MSDSFKTTFVVYASPEHVFEAFTDPGIIGAWGGGLSVVELMEGGRFEWFDGAVTGRIISFVPARELSFTWKPAEWPKQSAPSTVQLFFKTHPAGTAVVLNHTNLPPEEDPEKHGNGWVDLVFDPINDYFTEKMG